MKKRCQGIYITRLELLFYSYLILLVLIHYHPFRNHDNVTVGSKRINGAIRVKFYFGSDPPRNMDCPRIAPMISKNMLSYDFGELLVTAQGSIRKHEVISRVTKDRSESWILSLSVVRSCWCLWTIHVSETANIIPGIDISSYPKIKFWKKK